MTPEVTTPSSDPTHATASHPEVSVIIPVYNCQRYITETLQSVFDQNLSETQLEIIAIDDGSTDDSLEILLKLADQHSNFIVESIPNSGSASAPRNRGLELATGEYVFFLDADDKLADGALERLLEVAHQTNSGVIACKLGPFGPAKRASALPSRAFGKSQFEVDFIDSKAFTTLGALKLFRRSILQDHQIRFPLGYAVGEDQPFTMQAYFHSPHVSILSDRIYYWARGRDDGTNVTSIGQPATEHYKKIKELIEVVASFNLPPERREPLLERPTVAPTGFQTVFGGSFLRLFNAHRRKEVIHELHYLVAPLMTGSLRARGNAEAQIIADLICRDDVASLEELCRSLDDRRAMPLEFDEHNQEFVYLPKHGSPIGDLKLSLESQLTQIEYADKSIGFKGTVVLPGATRSPDVFSSVWIHRRSGRRVVAPSQTHANYMTDRGLCSEFSSRLDLNLLDLSSEWDAFVELEWGSCTLRQRFGKAKGSGIKTGPVFFGSQSSAVAFFTKFGNLSIDIGPTREYTKALSSAHPQIIGSFPSPKRQTVIIEGQLSNIVDALVSVGTADKDLQADLHRLTETCIAVVLPRRIKAKSKYTIRLVDTADNQITAVDTRENP